MGRLHERSGGDPRRPARRRHSCHGAHHLGAGLQADRRSQSRFASQVGRGVFRSRQRRAEGTGSSSCRRDRTMALRFAAGYDHDWVLILEAKSPGAAPPSRETGASAEKPAQLTLANEHLAWRFDWTDGRLRSSSFENKLSGHRFARSSVQELALNFSASLDCVQEPFTRMADFEVAAAKLIADHHPVYELRGGHLEIGHT